MKEKRETFVPYNIRIPQQTIDEAREVASKMEDMNTAEVLRVAMGIGINILKEDLDEK